MTNIVTSGKEYQYKGYKGNSNFERNITTETEATSFTYYGKITNINDLVTYEADSLEGVEAEFRNAVDDYIDTCPALRRKPTLLTD